ncbi:MAG: NUDIX domain-containing protein [Candidatus Aenigmatarchaeota archaeon]
MDSKEPKVSLDILVVKDGKFLLGLLTDKWNYGGKPVWGVPGREINFGEKIGDALRRNIKEEFGCNATVYNIICVNANYALGNHYIGIGAVAKIDGEPKLLIPEDWKKWEWFSEDKIPKNLFPATKNLVECYLRGKFIISE